MICVWIWLAWLGTFTLSSNLSFWLSSNFCEGVGVVKRVHTLLGGVHRLATALKEVEEVREEVQEIKDEWEDEEVEENGGLKVEEKRSSHAWMR